MSFLIGEGKKAQNIELTTKLYHVANAKEGGEEKVCIDIQRTSGDVYTFFEEFKYI